MANRPPRLPTPAERLTAMVTALGAVLLPITVLGGDAHNLVSLLTAHSDSRATPPAPPPKAAPGIGAGGQLATDPPPTSLSAVTKPSAPSGQQFAQVPAGQLGIPQIVLDAYMRAAQTMATTTPQCGLHWSILAGIGRIESNHARGGEVDAAGTTLTPILGPELNGSPGVAAISDTDHGVLDGDVMWDRAVGPMQFIPSTWRHWAPTPQANPNNVNDASLATAQFLCANGANLRDPAQLVAAIYRYNPSYSYVRTVLEWATRYASGVIPLPPGFPPADVAPPELAASVPLVGAPAPGEPPPLPGMPMPPPAAPGPPPGEAAPPPGGSAQPPGGSAPPPAGSPAPPPPPPSTSAPPPPPPSSAPPPPPPSSSTPPPPPPTSSSTDPPPASGNTDPTTNSEPTTTTASSGDATAS